MNACSIKIEMEEGKLDTFRMSVLIDGETAFFALLSEKDLVNNALGYLSDALDWLKRLKESGDNA